MDAPLAEQATFRETGGPHDLSDHVHLSHCPERGKYNHSFMRKVYNYLHLIDGKTEAHQVRSNVGFQASFVKPLRLRFQP